MKPPAAKRWMRAVWLRLPRSRWSYRLAKLLTRTVLRPEREPLHVEARVAGRFAMRLDLSNVAGNDIYCMDDHYEAATLALWSRLALRASTVVDLGAHAGLYACAAAARNPAARVIAVEAFPPNAKLLRENAAPFPNLTAAEMAIGLTGGPAVFRLSPITSGGYVDETTAEQAVTPGRRDQTGEGFAVDAVSLVHFCERLAIERIDLMKMDLEGLEPSLLAGQEDFWSRWAPRDLIVELTIGRPRTAIDDRAFVAMATRGYRFRRVERLYTFPFFRGEDLANWHFWKES